MSFPFVSRSWRVPLFLLTVLIAHGPAAHSAGQAVVSNVSLRPFVIGFIPVIGRNGAVGGVSVDARGVVERITVEQTASLRRRRQRALAPAAGDISRESPLRKVSLRRLEEALLERWRQDEGASEAMFYLAGLQRISHVFVYPDQRDIVIAGPADAWEVDNHGAVVGRVSRWPVLRLDDLTEMLRATLAAGDGEGVGCSIDPSREGIQRLQRLLSRRSRGIGPQFKAQLEKTAGPQIVTITGVPADSRFASVMLAADIRMKRLAMGLEQSPVAGLPSYLRMLAKRKGPLPRDMAPRWWMEPHYAPLERDTDGLAWRIAGPGVRTLTEAGRLGQAGEVVAVERADTLAQEWADAMTEHYGKLARKLPVFAELRNLIDLAVTAALIDTWRLGERAEYDLGIWRDAEQAPTAAYPIPRTVPSHATLARVGRDWMVSVSGGVRIDSWAVLEKIEVDEQLQKSRRAAAPAENERWWWD